MKKTLAIMILTMASMYAQTFPTTIVPGATSVFQTTGVSFGGTSKDVLFGVGVSQRIGAKQSVVTDLSTSISRTSGVGLESVVIVGLKQDLGTVKVGKFTFKPFTVAGYGATLKNAAAAIKTGAVKNSSDLLTAASTNTLFTQQYALGATVLVSKKVSIGFGYKEQKAASVQAYGYPFVITSFTF